MINCMLDLETLGVNSNAPVVSIGAVFFDKTLGLGPEFYAVLDVDPQIGMYNRKVDGSTVRWWMQQGEAARSVFIEQGKHPSDVLVDFTRFVQQNGTDVLVWGNGSDFDNVILGNLFIAVYGAAPWKFYNNRCYRTLKNLGIFPSESHNMPVRQGTHHNALDDARYQAEMAIRYLRGVGGAT